MGLETYYSSYGYSSRENITFATLKLLKHSLTWGKYYRKEGEVKGEKLWKKQKNRYVWSLQQENEIKMESNWELDIRYVL